LTQTRVNVKLTGMVDFSLDQLISVVEEGTDAPLDRISAAALLKEQVERLGDDLLDHFVQQARGQGCSWTQIGEALGVTRQAAQQRHTATDDRLLRGIAEGRELKRFTPRARTAVMNAQTVAQEHRHNYVGTEHLLLGLFVAEDGNLAVKALAALGVEREAIERLVDERIPRGGAEVSGVLPFTPRARQAVADAVGEALKLGHNYVGTEHQLLALRQIEEGIAAKVLDQLEVSYDGLKAKVIQLLSGLGLKGPTEPPTQED
jgi:Clp amino terminal domain, pathogenicity island component